MRSGWRRGAAVAAVGTLGLLLTTGSAFAHTGADAGTGHIVLEFAKWGGAVGGALVGIVAYFWLRTVIARRRKR